jgi:hypothetical protein
MELAPWGWFRQRQEGFGSSSGHAVQYDVMCRGEEQIGTSRNPLLGRRLKN